MSGSDCASRVLLTGFGLFPGVRENISHGFALDVARQLTTTHTNLTCKVAELETVWTAGRAAIAELIRAFRPDVVIMFGVSHTATGLVIERQAVNACGPNPDAHGCVSAEQILDPNGPSLRASSFPASALHTTLRKAGHDVSLSDDAGRYLCNAVLFDAIGACDEVCPRAMAGFVHLPVSFGPEAKIRDDAMAAGVKLVEMCVAQQRAHG